MKKKKMSNNLNEKLIMDNFEYLSLFNQYKDKFHELKRSFTTKERPQ